MTVPAANNLQGWILAGKRCLRVAVLPPTQMADNAFLYILKTVHNLPTGTKIFLYLYSSNPWAE